MSTTAKSIPEVGKAQRQPAVMIVDDELDILITVKMVLNKSGFQNVDIFSDPLRALADFKADKYDLVVLDIRMPEMSGYDLYREIRKQDKNVRVCFVSAFEDYFQEFSKLFPNDKAECFMRKPMTMSELLQKIKERLA
ncbi:MAG: response regulator [Nitrososphaera sp.]|uniref:response regulator n=1 Tax=Nitrososphaera sp. TaxID=1971748 RepID=UPI003D6E0D34